MPIANIKTTYNQVLVEICDLVVILEMKHVDFLYGFNHDFILTDVFYLLIFLIQN